MALIRSKNTKPELLVRRALFARGLRYRLHGKKLPGKPDIIFPKYKAVIFIHGCFWHGHNCPAFRLPQTRREYWLPKISGNAARDKKHITDLQTLGWRVCVIWECVLRGKHRLEFCNIIDKATKWLFSAAPQLEI